MNQATADFVEQLGLLMEAERYPRIAGRIVGLLLVSEDARSLDDIADTLAVTKASVSTNARMLEERGVLERVSLPGDRRDHYRASVDLPRLSLAARVARLERLRDALAVGRKAINPRSPAVQDRLQDMITAYAHMLDVNQRALAELPDRIAQARTQRRRAR